MRARSMNADHDGNAQDRNNRTGKHRYAAARPAAQRIFGLKDQPARAEQRITKHEADPAQDRKRCDPVERASGKLAVHDRYSADHGSDRGALDKGRNERADSEAAIPESACSAPSAEFERDAAEYQSQEEQQHRDVKGPQEHCVNGGEGCEQRGAHHDQPGLVAVPEWRNRSDHFIPQRLVFGGAEKDPDAQVKAVQDDVGENRQADHGEPRTGLSAEGSAALIGVPPWRLALQQPAAEPASFSPGPTHRAQGHPAKVGEGKIDQSRIS